VQQHHARQILRTELAVLLFARRRGIPVLGKQMSASRAAAASAWARLADNDLRELSRAAADAEKIARHLGKPEHSREHPRGRDDCKGLSAHSVLHQQMDLARRQAQKYAEELLTLARVREQHAHNAVTGGSDDAATRRGRQAAAEVVAFAGDRMTEIRGKVLDALASERSAPRPLAVAAATTANTNEHLRERAKRERQEVHHAAPPSAPMGGTTARGRKWRELPHPERQRIIKAIKAGRAVALPVDAPSELRLSRAGLEHIQRLLRRARSCGREAEF